MYIYSYMSIFMSIFMYVSYVGFLIHSWFSSDIPYVGFPAAALSQGSAGSAGSAAPYFKGTAKETKERTKRSRVIRPFGGR